MTSQMTPALYPCESWPVDSFKVCCPKCRFEYQHHGGVLVFDRVGGEDGPSIVTAVDLPIDQITDDNPSSRRGAIRVFFVGECSHEWWLDIVQHKGETYLFAGMNEA